MKKLFPLLAIPLLIITSCGKSKINEGEITYDITYPHMDVTGLMSAILPKEMTIVFSGTMMMTTISRGRIFETRVITDEADNSMEMRLDFGDKKYYCELTKEELDILVNSSQKYNIKKAEEKDSLNGVFCQKYLVSSEDSIQPGNAWFTEDLTIQNGAWFSAYKDLVGMPIIYDVQRYGILMHVESNNFSQREILEDEFARDPNLEKVDFETYETEVQELFNILLD